MKRLRATVDIYVDMDDDMTEDDAKDSANELIDSINFDYKNTDLSVSLSEIIQYEIYDTEQEIDKEPTCTKCGSNVRNDTIMCSTCGEELE